MNQPDALWPIEDRRPTSDRHVFVLGASQGIGLGFVRRLLSEGYWVHATYRDRQSAAPLFELAANQTRLSIHQLDITEEAQIVTCLEAIAADLSRSNASLCQVVNCIGMLHQGELQPEKSLRQINSENLLTYFQVNSIASILLAKHLVPLIKKSDRAVFVTLSAKVGSIADNQLGGWYGYRASKAALNMFMKTIALEYRRSCKNTIVAVLHPGTTDTQLSGPFQRNVPAEKLFSIDRCVDQLCTVINGLTLEDSGEFFSWDGTRLPW
jgi:NAD(P)-dependent dehydrogenase (short-subunit alcohol dehydrogenase family)